jgi:hypothetical protein
MEGGLDMEIKTFLGPVKWHRADRRVSFWAQKKLSNAQVMDAARIKSMMNRAV